MKNISKVESFEHRITNTDGGCSTGPKRRGWGAGLVQPREGWLLWWDLTTAAYSCRVAVGKLEPGTSQLCMVEGKEAKKFERSKLCSGCWTRNLQWLLPI